MSDRIDRAKLAKVKFESLLRLAKALKIHGCACGSVECRQDIEEKIIRELDIQSMERHKKES